MKLVDNLKHKAKQYIETKKQNKIKEKNNLENYNFLIANEKARIKKDEVVNADSYITLNGINKVYDNHVQAVYDFNLKIKKGEFIVFVGPSGCGKSTTLRMIAGLEDITTGDLFIDGVLSNYLKPVDRNVAMVFQNYALYPHLSVYENMAIGLKTKHVPKEEIDRRIKQASKMLELDDYLDRKPRALSGGQCQRVALGRAIVKEAKVFLMDEPLSNLDAKLRVQMRGEIIKLHKSISATTIYVTHDQVEAMTMADRIVVMNKGHIQQIGTPEEIYNNPANLFVAGFMGAPAMNLVECSLKDELISFANVSLELNKFGVDSKTYYQNLIEELKNNLIKHDKSIYILQELEGKLASIDKETNSKEYENILSEIDQYKKNDQFRNSIQTNIDLIEKHLSDNEFDLVFGIRAEDISLTPFDNCIKFSGVIENIELLGNEYHIHTRNKGQSIIFKVNAQTHFTIGQNIDFYCNLDKAHVYDKITTQLIK